MLWCCGYRLQGEAVASMGGFGRAAENRPGSQSFKEVCKTLNESASTKPRQAAEGYWEEEEEEVKEGGGDGVGV